MSGLIRESSQPDANLESGLSSPSPFRGLPNEIKARQIASPGEQPPRPIFGASTWEPPPRDDSNPSTMGAAFSMNRTGAGSFVRFAPSPDSFEKRRDFLAGPPPQGPLFRPIIESGKEADTAAAAAAAVAAAAAAATTYTPSLTSREHSIQKLSQMICSFSSSAKFKSGSFPFRRQKPFSSRSFPMTHSNSTNNLPGGTPAVPIPRPENPTPAEASSWIDNCARGSCQKPQAPKRSTPSAARSQKSAKREGVTKRIILYKAGLLSNNPQQQSQSLESEREEESSEDEGSAGVPKGRRSPWRSRPSSSGVRSAESTTPSPQSGSLPPRAAAETPAWVSSEQTAKLLGLRTKSKKSANAGAPTAKASPPPDLDTSTSTSPNGSFDPPTRLSDMVDSALPTPPDNEAYRPSALEPLIVYSDPQSIPLHKRKEYSKGKTSTSTAYVEALGGQERTARQEGPSGQEAQAHQDAPAHQEYKEPDLTPAVDKWVVDPVNVTAADHWAPITPAQQNQQGQPQDLLGPYFGYPVRFNGRYDQRPAPQPRKPQDSSLMTSLTFKVGMSADEAYILRFGREMYEHQKKEWENAPKGLYIPPYFSWKVNPKPEERVAAKHRGKTGQSFKEPVIPCPSDRACPYGAIGSGWPAKSKERGTKEDE